MKRAPALELTRTFCFVRRSTRNAQVAGLKVLWLKGSLVRMPLMRQTLSPVTSPPLNLMKFATHYSGIINLLILSK